ncbi:MAG: hypothetical protein KME17_23440 [Cyanosarcina radialis HA8281-LM2]|jgi:NRE family putative nickel resistance protein-like MFS transporter|nr:hypothetical protein [Cyanosarcina radialis HA8281-LM2]
MQSFQLFRSLRNPIFARLYAAQTTNLLGDALTWLGLAFFAVVNPEKLKAIDLRRDRFPYS